jgi:hypothetical protein
MDLNIALRFKETNAEVSSETLYKHSAVKNYEIDIILTGQYTFNERVRIGLLML